MKKCNILKEDIIEYIYGELDENNKKVLEEHIEHCSLCREEVIKMKKTLLFVEGKEIKSPGKEFWEECWMEIRKNIRPLHVEEKERAGFIEKLRKFFDIPSGIGFKLAGIAAVLIIGIFIGRNVTFGNRYDQMLKALERLDNPVEIQTLENSDDQRLFQLASLNFLKKTEIILLEFSAMSAVSSNANIAQEISFIKDLSSGLIREIRIFKKIAEKFENKKLKELFNIMELILIEINDLNEEENFKGLKDIRKNMVDSGLFIEIRNIKKAS